MDNFTITMLNKIKQVTDYKMTPHIYKDMEKLNGNCLGICRQVVSVSKKFQINNYKIQDRDSFVRR